MAIKWIGTKLKKNKDMLIKLVKAALIIAEGWFVILVLSTSGDDFYNPIFAAMMFAIDVPLFVCLAFALLKRIDKKGADRPDTGEHGEDKNLGKFAVKERGEDKDLGKLGMDRRDAGGIKGRHDRMGWYMRFGCIAVVLYILIMVLVLTQIRPQWSVNVYMVALLFRDMEWIVAGAFLVPSCSFIIPFMIGIQKREKILFKETEDIEERIRHAVNERTKSERMKIDLITNVSHDLKTPLTSVIGYIALIQKEEMSQTVREYVDVLARKTDLLKDMIDNVFELAKVTSGNVELKKERIELNRLIEQTLADMQDVIEEKNKIFKLNLTDADTQVLADGTSMYRVIQNLIGNAVKYSMEGTRIFIDTRVCDGEAVLEIANVSSYPLDFDVETLKERFVRADASRSSEGNGLGLAIVDTYISAMGGTFTIRTDGDVFKAGISFVK